MKADLIAIKPKKDKYMSLTWQVNNHCNYRCSYCNPGNWSGTDKNNGNLDIYIKNLNKLIKTYQKKDYKYFKFFFSGGEPTYWENLIPIIEYIKKILPSSTIAINTNLSRPLSYWKKYYSIFDDIVASFHIEFVKKDRYLENLYFLCDKVDYLSAKMLMHEERFWEVVNFGNQIREKIPNYNLEWTPLFDELSTNAKPWQYMDIEKTRFIEQAKFETKNSIPKPYRENNAISISYYNDGSKEPTVSNKIISDRQNFFLGWKCFVDDSLFISPIGNISSASCGVGNNHGNILDNNLEFNLSSVICSKKHCHCGTDIIIPKSKY